MRKVADEHRLRASRKSRMDDDDAELGNTVLRLARRPHLRPHHPQEQRWPDHLGRRRRRLLALQSEEGQSDAAACQDVPPVGALCADRAPAASHNRLFPPNYLHASWLDYLYRDTELDPSSCRGTHCAGTHKSVKGHIRVSRFSALPRPQNCNPRYAWSAKTA
jgi:hypothetical protein